MSTKHFTANVISATKVVPDGNFQSSAASGVWDLSEQYDLRRGGNWPETGNADIANRGVFAGGYTGSVDSDVIDFVDIASTGNAIDFGNLTSGKWSIGALSSATRGLFAGRYNFINNIDYIVLGTTGNASDFGDLSTTSSRGAGCSSKTRGIFAIGLTGTDAYSNIIEYVTIANTGNTTDFGNLTVARRSLASCSSPTRGIWAGGSIGGGPPFNTNVIDYVTIASTGNATDFGDLNTAADSKSNVSSSTRGVIKTSYGGVTMDYITIGTTGNATDFGDLVNATASMGGCSSNVRGLFAGSGNTSNVIEYITIANTGNATDFGDLTVARGSNGQGCSGGHGGLQ